MHKKKSWFIDKVVLINFCMADSLQILMERYSSKLNMTQEVYQEVLRGYTSGYRQLRLFLDLLEKDNFEITSLTDDERKEYFLLVQHLGSGESSCIAAAHFRHAIVMTDDKMARTKCQERSIPFTGTIGIIKALCLDKQLSLREADSIHKKMMDAGFYSPVQSISALF